MKIVDRFLKYVSFETTSDASSTTCPTTKGQLILGEYLAKEMKEIGLTDVYQDEHGYVYGTLPSNTDKDVLTIGFIAHMDTSPDASGKDVKPQFIDYKGGDIKLNENVVMTEKEFPYLKDVVGERLITTDGTTLLGADDKAGIAIIMTAMEELINNPEVKHGTVKVGFTPDEEIGRGADLFDVKTFNADFAYTVDGGAVGDLNYENFNAASATIKIKGKMVHPGSAKDILVNSQLIGMELNAMLPSNQRPETTEKYEGFYMLTDFNGDVVDTTMSYIIRDHSKEKFEQKKDLLKEIVAFLNKKYNNALTLEMEDTYYNMEEKIAPTMYMIDIAKEAMEKIGIEPDIKAVRGGSDGSKLSFMGLPCPNFFAGGYNFHGIYEFIPESSLVKGKDLVIQIVKDIEQR